jgi:hypothetical protein
MESLLFRSRGYLIKNRLYECKRLLGKGKKEEGRETGGDISKWHTRDEKCMRRTASLPQTDHRFDTA